MNPKYNEILIPYCIPVKFIRKIYLPALINPQVLFELTVNSCSILQKDNETWKTITIPPRDGRRLSYLEDVLKNAIESFNQKKDKQLNFLYSSSQDRIKALNSEQEYKYGYSFKFEDRSHF